MFTAFSALTLFISVYSCTKQTHTSEEKSHVYVPTTTTKVANTNFEENIHNFSEIVEGVDNTDTKLRKIRLYLSVGLVEVVKDSTIANWIYYATMQSENREIKFSDLFAAFPQTRDIVESAIDPLGQISEKSLEDLEDELDYEGYQYWASIYLTNENSADGEYKPIITPGLDIEDIGEISDIAFAWHLDGNNNISKIRIWEELANSTPAPVFAVSMMVKKNYPTSSVVLRETSSAPPDYINDRADISSFKIYHQYDKSKNSEYCITGAWIKNTGGASAYLRYTCLGALVSGAVNTQNHYTKLADVHKKNLGSERSCNRLFCRLRTTDELDASKYVFFNTFERDWFAGVKDLGSIINSAGQTLKMKGNFSNAHEWYQFNPNNVNLGSKWVNVWGIWFAGLGNITTNNADAGKGYVKFKRLNPCN